LTGFDAVFIARASPTRVFSSGIDIGYRLPAFCTSSAASCCRDYPTMNSPPRWRRWISRRSRRSTVTDKKRLLQAIRNDRAQDYSLVDREAEPGFPLDLGAGAPL